MSEVLPICVSVALFGTVHSILASYGAKSLARRAFGPTAAAIYRLIFNVIAVVSIAPALYLAVTLPDRELYRWPQPLNYVALAVQALGGLGVLYALYQLDLPFFVGLRQLIEPARSSIHYSI